MNGYKFEKDKTIRTALCQYPIQNWSFKFPSDFCTRINFMKHDQTVGSRKMEKLSRAAASGKLLSHLPGRV